MIKNFDQKAYEAYNYEAHKGYIHRSLTLAIFLFLSFGLLDYVMFEPIFGRLAVIRYGMFLPVAIPFLIIMRTQYFKRYSGAFVSLIILASSIISNLMQINSGELGHSVYFSGQLVIVLYLFTGSRLLFKWSFVTGIGMIVLYNMIMITTNPDPYEIVLLMKDNTFLIASFVLGALTSYGLERYLVKDYLNDMNTQSQLLDEMTQRKYSESQLLYFASHDELTGLYNRRYFGDELALMIERSIAQENEIAVVLMDIDHFKIVNDSLGHEMGDNVLKIITERLERLKLPGTVIARIGGDEFGLLIQDRAKLDRILDEIVMLLDDPVQVYPHHFHISMSIGVSLYPEHRISADELIRCAETAMYQAKDNGKNRIEIFSEAYDLAIQKRGRIARKLKNALDAEQFFMVYQQKVDVKNEEIQGFEALIRWEDPEEGMIPPDLFIKVAEETGQIATLGSWVLDTACKEFMSLAPEIRSGLKLSINLSTIELQQQDIADKVAEVINKYDMDAQSLCLEITESAIIQSLDCVVEAISRFKAIGVDVSIDDFGTGFSSLAYLSKLDVEELKIDRAFVMKIGVKEDDMIIRTISALGKGLKLRVVAEGVETQEQIEFLRTAGVDLLQGYKHGKPMKMDEWMSLLSSNS